MAQATCTKGGRREWYRDGEWFDDDGHVIAKPVRKQPPDPIVPGAFFCTHWGMMTGPKQIACDVCLHGLFPAYERFRVEILPQAIKEKGRSAAEDLLVKAVQSGQIYLEDAERLAHDLFPG